MKKILEELVREPGGAVILAVLIGAGSLILATFISMLTDLGPDSPFG